MSVDWNRVSAALQKSREGNNLKALDELSALLGDADSDTDRAAILLGQSSCYSQLGDLGKTGELIEAARRCAQGSREILSQVEMSEGSLYAQKNQSDAACEKFLVVKDRYSDLLAIPENDDFAMELDSRLACTLVEAGRYGEAIQIFRQLFMRKGLLDTQRLELFFGIALTNVGQTSDAQRFLFSAAKGLDPALSESASAWLTRTSTSSRSQ